MNNNITTTELQELKETFRLLFGIRNKVRTGLSEYAKVLKKRILKTDQDNPTEGLSNIDMFYSIGGALTGHDEALTMGEISRSLKVPLSTATRIVDWLVSNGLAIRLTDADDRRIVRVALTAEGHNMYQQIDQFFIERVQRLFRDFTPQESKTFQELLKKVVNSLDQEF